MDKTYELVNQVLQNPVGALILVMLVLALVLLYDQRRRLIVAQGAVKVDETDSQITLELIRNNDKFHSKVDKLTDALNALTTATQSMLDQEARRITMREEALKNEHADRERLFTTQESLSREMNASVQAINNLAVSLSENIQRGMNATLNKVAGETSEALALKMQTGFLGLTSSFKAEVQPMTDNLQQIIQQLKTIEANLTTLADHQAKDSAQLRTELQAVAVQVADTAKRIEATQKPDAAASA